MKYIKKIAAKKALGFLKEVNILNEQKCNDLAFLGMEYINSFAYQLLDLHIKWLEFKAYALINLFNLIDENGNNPKI